MVEQPDTWVEQPVEQVDSSRHSKAAPHRPVESIDFGGQLATDNVKRGDEEKSNNVGGGQGDGVGLGGRY